MCLHGKTQTTNECFNAISMETIPKVLLLHSQSWNLVYMALWETLILQ